MCSLVIGMIIISSIVTQIYGQSNEDPKRYEPEISEDQIIICVKDVEHKDYFGQLSCIINNDGLDNPTLKKLGKQASSLENTFEMGLID